MNDETAHDQQSGSWKRSVVSSLKWSAAARLVGQLWTWLVTLFIIRLLSPNDYGIMAMAMVFVQLAMLVRYMGVQPAIIQRPNVSDQELRSCKSVSFLISYAIAILVFLISYPVAALYGEPEVGDVMRVLSIVFILTPIGAVESSLLRKTMQFRKFSLVELSSTLISSTAALVLAYLGAGVWALVAGLIVKQSTLSLGCMIMYGESIGFSRSLRLSLPFIRFGIPASLQQITAEFANSGLQNFLVSTVHGVGGVGMFSVALNLSKMPVSKAMFLVNTVMMPAYSNIQEDKGRVRYSYSVGAGALATAFIASLWGLVCIADILVPLVLGATWLEAMPLVQIASFWVPLTALAYLFPSMAIALGKPTEAVKANLLYCVWIAIAVGASALGDVQSCMVAVGFASLVYALDTARRISRLLERPISWTVLPMGVPLVAGAAMLGAVFAFVWGGLEPANAWLALAARIILGAAVFIGVFMLIGRKQFFTYLNIVRGR